MLRGSSLSGVAIHDASLIEMLDQWEVKMIAEFLSASNTSLLRATCAFGASNIVIPMGIKMHGTWRVLLKATKKGHRDICILAHKWGALDFDGMLRYAALYGHRDLCILAREWIDNSFANWKLGKGGHYVNVNHEGMVINAACGGHRDICELARKWNDEDHTALPINFDHMLRSATEGNHQDICELAREWINESSAKK